MFADLLALLLVSQPLVADITGQGPRTWTDLLHQVALTALLSTAMLPLALRMSLGIRPSKLGTAAAVAWLRRRTGQPALFADGLPIHAGRIPSAATTVVPAALMLGLL
jgi:hypothetical protein